MRIVLHTVANLLLGDVLTPYTSVSKEEALSSSKAILVLQRLLGCRILECIERYHQTTVVGKVLTQCKATVGIQIRQYLDVAEEISIHIGTLIEALSISSGPPILQVTAGIILATLIVETVSHLMTNHYTDSTIVECRVSLGIEEWILKDTCREADLIGSRIIVGIHSLWSHIPFISVDWLTSLLSNLLIVAELTASHHVLIETLGWVDGKLAIVSPLVRITNLDIELIELIVGSSLGLCTHPLLSIDTLTETHLEILDQSLHHLLG